LTDANHDWIERVAKIRVDESGEIPDVVVVELGGTIGDIENAPFVEALRQFRRRAGKANFLHIHVSLIPVTNGEQKTKPTQQAIRDVRSAGVNPDLVCSFSFTSVKLFVSYLPEVFFVLTGRAIFHS
jgi:CTP synthase